MSVYWWVGYVGYYFEELSAGVLPTQGYRSQYSCADVGSDCRWSERVSLENGGVAQRGNGCWLTANDEGTTTLADRRSGTEASLIRSDTHIRPFLPTPASASESVEVLCTILNLAIFDQCRRSPTMQEVGWCTCREAESEGLEVWVVDKRKRVAYQIFTQCPSHHRGAINVSLFIDRNHDNSLTLNKCFSCPKLTIALAQFMCHDNLSLTLSMHWSDGTGHKSIPVFLFGD